MTYQVVLASSSPRRAELLRQMAIRFKVCPPDIEETIRTWETPLGHVKRMATAKVAAREGSAFPRLAADTLVVYRGVIFGKPRDRQEGMEMLNALAGTEHTVLTAVALLKDKKCSCVVSQSKVWMLPISHTLIEKYWETGEPEDKAGSYGLQGIGAVFVDRIEGSPSGVAGLPIQETEKLLHTNGIDTWTYRCKKWNADGS